jgi:hypothetical protein
LVLVICMSSASWLLRQVNTKVIIIVRHESRRHATTSSQFAVSPVKSLFELATCRNIQLVIFALVIDHSSLICVLVSSLALIFHEVVAEEVNAILFFRHLVQVIVEQVINFSGLHVIFFFIVLVQGA